jgi:hypothetical protein
MGGHIHPRITDSFEILSCYANGRRGIFVLILHSQKNCIDRINHVRRISISSMVDRLPKPQFQRQLATSFKTTKKKKGKRKPRSTAYPDFAIISNASQTNCI